MDKKPEGSERGADGWLGSDDRIADRKDGPRELRLDEIRAKLRTANARNGLGDPPDGTTISFNFRPRPETDDLPPAA